LHEYFARIEDPRIVRNKRQLVMAILMLLIRALISGADCLEAIEQFG